MEAAQRAVNRRRQVAALLQVASNFGFTARAVAEIAERRLHGLGRGFGGRDFSFLERQNNLRTLSNFALFLFVRARRRRCCRSFAATLRYAGLIHYFADDFAGGFGMLFQKSFGCFASLSDAFAAVGIPGAALFDDVLLAAQVNDFAVARDSRAVKDIELGFLERRRHFVLHDFDAGPAADYVVAVLERANAANVHAHRSVKLE